jgi:hypothetical protein
MILLAVGAYLLWFGVTHFGQKNPAAPLKSLLTGKGLT